MRVVIATDSFKGTIAAAEAGTAIAAGWHSVRAHDDLRVLPMADGGEGTLDAIAGAAPGVRRVVVRVSGPDSRPVDTAVLRLPDGTAVVELASTSGLGLLDSLRPTTAHTRGFGQAIRAALDAGATGLLLALGGSASTDGGVGMLRELGARFLDAAGAPIGDGGRALDTLREVDLAALSPPPPGGVRVLTDVTNPLLGPRGAAAVYGPQKGASSLDVAALDAGLARLAALLPADPAIPGAGAAGGTGYGLLAWGARLVPGAHEVATVLGLHEACAGADLVITGEGRYDDQTAQGKVVAQVRTVAGAVPVALIAGSIEADVGGFVASVSLTDLVGRRAAVTDPSAALASAGAALAVRHRG